MPLPRLIPACAGKTGGRPVRGFGFWARPRVCGENWVRTLRSLMRAGSSPRVRGKRRPAERFRLRAGLIPACAGKTAPRPTGRPGGAAHPRVCGENAMDAEAFFGSWGSSPRVRGKHLRVARPRPGTGLIPACAGKTSTARARDAWDGAHPRGCGENPSSGRQLPPVRGSSPRVRGKHPSRRPISAFRRLIPACAGKTPPGAWPPGGRAAHPRVCGENSKTTLVGHLPSGSSPRVRGKRWSRCRRRATRRLIPACAGKTAFWVCATTWRRAHPRVCGENPSLAVPARGRPGSSPRVRGKPHQRVDRRRLPRLIPACAGKTPYPRG